MVASECAGIQYGVPGITSCSSNLSHNRVIEIESHPGPRFRSHRSRGRPLFLGRYSGSCFRTYVPHYKPELWNDDV